MLSAALIIVGFLVACCIISMSELRAPSRRVVLTSGDEYESEHGKQRRSSRNSLYRFEFSVFTQHYYPPALGDRREQRIHGFTSLASLFIQKLFTPSCV